MVPRTSLTRKTAQFGAFQRGTPVALQGRVTLFQEPSQMRKLFSNHLLAGVTLAISMAATAAMSAQAPLAIASGRVTLAGTSNVHAYTAATTTVRVTAAKIGVVPDGAALWDRALDPGVIETFEIAIPAATLASPKGDLDKNMHKALKVEQFPDITFRLVRFDTKADAAGGPRAIGMLKIAGVEREVAVALTTKRSGAALTVHGSLDLLMTDYGVTPPKAMMGMLTTNPKVTITFDTVLAIPTT
jgi:polyisoprenoid-binding protein YceI